MIRVSVPVMKLISRVLSIYIVHSLDFLEFFFLFSLLSMHRAYNFTYVIQELLFGDLKFRD